MIRTTPFHARLSELNDQHLYTHWQGTLSALRYSHAPKHEYFAVRNGGRHLRHLAALQVPDHRARRRGVPRRGPRARPQHLPAGAGGYTLWCDDRGFVMQDGVVFRHVRRRLPAHLRAAGAELADPAPARAAGRARGRHRRLRDARRPGPALADRAGRPGARGRRASPTSGSPRPRSGRRPVTVSRTGYTGDLGLRAHRAGRRRRRRPRRGARGRPRPTGMRPFGEEALNMLRIEAGLPLVDVEWHDSRTAWTDHDRVTPKELGHGLDAQGRTRRQPPLRRQRGDPPRAGRRHVAVGDHRDRRRLGRLGPAPPRRRSAAHQGRAARWAGSPGCGTTTHAGRLRHQLLLLARPAAARRHRPGPARTSPSPAPTCDWRRPCTTARPRSPSARPRCRSSTPPGRRPAHDRHHGHAPDRRTARRTTPSSSAAATTA